jgi:hypothetical protein
MMTLLRGLHSIAAQRGDGLRPEFLRMSTPSPAWDGIERTSSGAVAEDIDGKPDDEIVCSHLEVRNQYQGLREVSQLDNKRADSSD